MFPRLLRDDKAQATVEYILMLSFVALLGAILSKKFLGPLMGYVTTTLDQKLGSSLFSRGGMHGRFPAP
jgi:Flp pilus assembly pilin Flp